MIQVFIRVRTTDFNRWQEVFDAGRSLRQARGQVNEQIYRSAQDPNDIAMLLTWKDEESFRKGISEDPKRLSWWMHESGVLDRPVITILNEVPFTWLEANSAAS